MEDEKTTNQRDDPSPPGEGGQRKALDGWGRPSTTVPSRIPRTLRKRMTPQEVKLWNWLREEIGPAGFHVRRQVPIDRFVVDFACLKRRLVIEIDGEHHGFDDQAGADRHRDDRLSQLGYRVLRFSNGEVDRNKRMVLDTIFARLSA